jgi:flagellar biosynthetic protein FlhB
MKSSDFAIVLGMHRPRVKVGALPFDLQLFAGEKTEPATDKRRQEARESGNIAKSQDLEGVVVMLVAVIALSYYGGEMFMTMGHFMKYHLGSMLSTELTPLKSSQLLTESFIICVKCLGPFLLWICIAAIVGNVFQVGWVLTFEPFVPNLDRFDPFAKIENLMTWQAFSELVKSVTKVVLVSYIPYTTLLREMPMFLRFIQIDPMKAMTILGEILFYMALKILLLLLVLGVLDYYYQEWRWEENLKMSHEDIKEEYKQREGDPKVKAKIRERQRKAATRRMMEEVPKATVVVTNPTHIAVALKYEPNGTSAPLVLAIGSGVIAQKIKEIAKEHGVPVIENKPLAQALHKVVDVGDEIPTELFEAVAQILAQVYTINPQSA